MLHGYWSLNKINLVQAKCHGGVDFSEPATYYYGLHFATQLSGPASAGSNTIAVQHPMAIGANLLIAPVYPGALDPNTEQHRVQNISGLGPYTVTLAAPLAFAHAATVYAAYDPGINGANVREHTGDNYTRPPLTNNSTSFPAPSDGVTHSGVQVTWSTPGAVWGLATHVLEWDAASGGGLWEVYALQSYLLLNPSMDTPKITVGNLIAQLITQL